MSRLTNQHVNLSAQKSNTTSINSHPAINAFVPPTNPATSTKSIAQNSTKPPRTHPLVDDFLKARDAISNAKAIEAIRNSHLVDGALFNTVRSSAKDSDDYIGSIKSNSNKDVNSAQDNEHLQTATNSSLKR